MPYDEHMTKRDISKFEHALNEELALLEQELKSVGRINPENPEDWEPTVDEPVTDTAEMESRASEITEFEDISSIEFELEERYNDIKKALADIKVGDYGLCHTCGKEIEEERLEANPAATTCKAHMD